jgi:peptidoglycan/LPS O-acetylase OafA/YrhL
MMWLPWSLILYIAIESKVKDIISMKMRSLLQYGLISLVIYLGLLASYFYLGKHTSEFNFINNKYPPNLYYFAYSLAVFGVVFAGVRLVKWTERAKKAVEFLSKNSYMLFFVHFLFLDALISWRKMSHAQIPVLIQLIGIIGISIGVVYGYHKLRKLV